MIRRHVPLLACFLFVGCRFGFEEVLEQALEGDSASLGGAPGDGVGDGDMSSSGGAGDGDTGDGDMSPSGGVGGIGGAAASGGIGGADTSTTGVWGTPTGAEKAYCAEIAQLDAPPVIDGILDPGVFLEEVVPVGWRIADPIPEGNSIFFGAAWRPDGIYFFFVVFDPDYVQANRPGDITMDVDIWQGDSVEFYVDHDGVFDAPIGEYAEFGTRQIMIASPPSADTPNTDRAMVRRNTSGPNQWAYYNMALWVSKPFDEGYIVEGFVDATTLNLASLSFSEDDVIGINISHNVSGTPPLEGNRLSQYFMNLREPLEGNVSDYPFHNEQAFCQARLIRE